jgi:two-component system, sensor histidine kinase LadS
MEQELENKALDLRSLFTTMDTSRFKEVFESNEKCLQILAEAKWKDGFTCRKCGSNNFGKGKSPYARRCTRCKIEESATANTIFHHCRIDLTIAFEIAYRVCGTPGIAASSLSQILDTRHMTCLKFKKKILECVSSHGDFAKNI